MSDSGMSCSVDCPGDTEADSVTHVDTNSNEETIDQDDPSNDPEPTTNYDSSDGAVHRCDRCDYETNSHSSLISHMNTCNDSRKIFECDVCQMKFSNGANMRRHKMRHTGVKPYECRICQKRFFRKDHLAEHFTTHTKTLPFHCPICNRGFQRQIAMRAHFQNEHVGQNDMIKSCPLCSYRATSMKSLRVHFYNRHGIDLDRPGSASDIASASNGVSSGGGGGSDSGDSARSADNATPPMHFLTPHVEISMTETPQAFSPPPSDPLAGGSEECGTVMNGDSPGSPQSGDSNTPSSSNHNGGQLDQSPMTPSVSLIPIKQEVDIPDEQPKRPSSASNLLAKGSSTLSALIKVSPLKSLLRDDLRRCKPSEAGSSSDVPNPDSVWRPSVPTNCSPKQRLHCVFCGIIFPDQTLYFLHKGCHSDSNPWKCNICGEQCCNVYDFNSHLLSKTHQ